MRLYYIEFENGSVSSRYVVSDGIIKAAGMIPAGHVIRKITLISRNVEVA